MSKDTRGEEERQELNMILCFLSWATVLKIQKKDSVASKERGKQEFDFEQADLAFYVMYDRQFKIQVWVLEEVRTIIMNLNNLKFNIDDYIQQCRWHQEGTMEIVEITQGE